MKFIILSVSMQGNMLLMEMCICLNFLAGNLKIYTKVLKSP